MTGIIAGVMVTFAAIMGVVVTFYTTYKVAIVIGKIVVKGTIKLVKWLRKE